MALGGMYGRPARRRKRFAGARLMGRKTLGAGQRAALKSGKAGVDQAHKLHEGVWSEGYIHGTDLNMDGPAFTLRNAAHSFLFGENHGSFLHHHFDPPLAKFRYPANDAAIFGRLEPEFRADLQEARR